MEDQINKAAHNLLNYFQKKEHKPKPEKKILQGTPVTYLGEVENITYARQDLTGRKIDFHKTLKGGMLIGFNEENYKYVIDVADQIFEAPRFSKYATVSFVENALCEWVFEKYNNDSLSEEPLAYLKRKLNDEIEDYIFYFPLIAIEIENNFEIGDCHIVCFDEYFKLNEIQKYELGSPNNSEEQFKSVIQKLENRIVAVIRATGILERAEKDAKYNSTLAINLLKAFLIEESINPYITICELEFNSYLLPKFNIFYQTSKSTFDLTSGIRSNFGVNPVQITTKILEEKNRIGFAKISSFLQKKNGNEIDLLITKTIFEIGNYTSERNIYERIVKIISVFESIFVPKKKGKGKGQTIIKIKVLPKLLLQSDIEMAIELFTEHYKIRDKYLHNRLELRIDFDKLFKFQYIPIILLRKLLVYRESYSTEDELMDFFEI